jgi:hypothetical protein
MVDRPAGIKAAEEIGLSLADGKTIIGQVQRRVVEMQFEVQARLGQHCRPRRTFDAKSAVLMVRRRTQPGAKDPA